ncbi:MAG: DUF2079 domain-containing protein [Acidimicrobiia bacterium]|nr:DUF2079 domain-containing protein [Acidimicrobiia bacterium]MYC58444.1 DUF2079 domain-containing protein [Acidimicrobiia bacterium]MYI30450.1 DUF2079 domain-containing protein [Acidimicrobiia bacterium]
MANETVVHAWSMTTFVHLRRRLEIFSLRWQARFDTKLINQAIPWVLAAVLGGLLLSLSLARARQLDAGTELSIHLQGLWLIGEGFEPLSSVAGHNLLWEQAAFILYPIALLTTLLPDQATLLSLQSAALGFAVVPLWRLARDVGRLKTGAAVAVVFAYCMYPAVHTLNLADFHPEALAVPALFAALLLVLKQRWKWFVPVALLIVICRSDLAFALSGLGLLVVARGERRQGAAISLVSAVYGLLSLTVIQPRFNAGRFPHIEAFSDFGTGSFGSVLWGFISAPHAVLAEALSQANFEKIVFLLAPVMLLPLVAIRYVVPVIPLFAIYLVADVPVGQASEASQTVPMISFVFVATVFALARSGRVLVERVNVDRRLLTALMLTASLFFLRDAPSSFYERPWDWGRQETLDVVRQSAANQIPADASVRASEQVLPLLSNRARLYELHTLDDPNAAALAATLQVEWIVFDAVSVPDWSPLDIESFDLDIRRSGFERLEVASGQAGRTIRLYRLRNVVQS